MVLSPTDALSVVIGGHCQSPHQLAWVDLEPVSQLEDVVEREVPPPTFNLADEGPVEAAGIGKLLLALTQLVPPNPDTLTKGLGRR